jgi:hypothetical protein
MMMKVSGIASGSSGRTPVSDFRTNSDAKVIIHDFFGVPKRHLKQHVVK